MNKLYTHFNSGNTIGNCILRFRYHCNIVERLPEYTNWKIGNLIKERNNDLIFSIKNQPEYYLRITIIGDELEWRRRITRSIQKPGISCYIYNALAVRNDDITYGITIFQSYDLTLIQYLNKPNVDIHSLSDAIFRLYNRCLNTSTIPYIGSINDFVMRTYKGEPIWESLRFEECMPTLMGNMTKSMGLMIFVEDYWNMLQEIEADGPNYDNLLDEMLILAKKDT